LSPTPARKPFQIRGLLLDPARVVERHEFYFDLLPQLAAWGYNTILWHFSDDEGFALKLDSRPQIASPYAFSKSQTARFIRSAAQHGIDVIPELESLGHSLAITGLPQYAHLFDGDPYDHNAICPSHRQTLPLLRPMIEEVAALFPSPYFHAGLDEIDLSGCPRCARRSRGKPDAHVLAEHIKAIRQIVIGCGKRMMMWADTVEKHPRLLKVLPKDILMLHWHYKSVPAERVWPSIKAGFEVVCVPKMCGMILQPDDAALNNVEQMVNLATTLPRRQCLGLIACWWEPARNVRDNYPLAAACTGRMFAAGKPVNRKTFTRSFVKDYFRLTDRAAGDALWRLHELVLTRPETKYLFPNDAGQVAEAVYAAQADGFDSLLNATRECYDTLKLARRNVAAHRHEYDAYLLSARITITARNNAVQLAAAAQAYRRAAMLSEHKIDRKAILDPLEQALTRIASLTAPMQTLARDVSAEWDRTRYARDRKKDGSSPRVRQRADRMLLPELLRCSRFLPMLARHFRHAVAVYRRGGPFPGGV